MNHKNTAPDYGNWVPIAMMKGMAAVLFALLALTIVLAWLLPFFPSGYPDRNPGRRFVSPVALYAALPRSVRLQPGRPHGKAPSVSD